MPGQIQEVFSKSLFSGNITAGGAQTAQRLPQGDSYTFYADITYTSGTSATLDISYQSSPDGGTTFYTFARHAQVTTASAIRRLVIQPMQGRGEAGTEALIGTTGALNANVCFDPKNFRLNFLTGGTNPTYNAAKIWVFVSPKSQVNV